MPPNRSRFPQLDGTATNLATPIKPIKSTAFVSALGDTGLCVVRSRLINDCIDVIVHGRVLGHPRACVCWNRFQSTNMQASVVIATSVSEGCVYGWHTTFGVTMLTGRDLVQLVIDESDMDALVELLTLLTAHTDPIGRAAARMLMRAGATVGRVSAAFAL